MIIVVGRLASVYVGYTYDVQGNRTDTLSYSCHMGGTGVEAMVGGHHYIGSMMIPLIRCLFSYNNNILCQL